MAWVLTTSLARLRADLNNSFPNRDHGSDGTIGDPAHQAEVSGHNPDDTADVRAEYSDADSKAEVRAFDADNDLRDPRGIDFQQVIDKILRTPADRDRLMYVIHRRKIWRKRNGWRQEAYTGASPHDEHGHFSGDPVHDDNDAPWTSVLSFKEEPDMDGTQAQMLTNLHDIVVAFMQGKVTGTWPHSGDTIPKLVPNEKLNQLATGGMDPAAVAALVVEQLGPLLPTLDDMRRIAREEARAALNEARLNVAAG